MYDKKWEESMREEHSYKEADEQEHRSENNTILYWWFAKWLESKSKVMKILER